MESDAEKEKRGVEMMKTKAVKALMLLMVIITLSTATGCSSTLLKTVARTSQEMIDQQSEQTEQVNQTLQTEQPGIVNPAELSDSLTGITDRLAADFAIPEYEGNPYVIINGNVPELDDSLKTEESFENYGPLDKHGRCTKAVANLSIDTQPAATEERGDISSVHPSGWRSGMGWERCHLIGWQLSAENDNRYNLVTGTHYMNVSGMLPFENRVDWYLEETGNHVLYEVEPVYKGKELVCRGVQMQAESVEDNGKGISFNVFCFNVSPGKEIDYKTGAVLTTDEKLAAENSFSRVYILNTNSKKFHYPTCSSVAQMAEHNKKQVTQSREELIKEGYSPCGNCEP